MYNYVKTLSPTHPVVQKSHGNYWTVLNNNLVHDQYLLLSFSICTLYVIMYLYIYITSVLLFTYLSIYLYGCHVVLIKLSFY